MYRQAVSPDQADDTALTPAQMVALIRHHHLSEPMIQRATYAVYAAVPWGPVSGQYGELKDRRERQAIARRIARDVLQLAANALEGLEEY